MHNEPLEKSPWKIELIRKKAPHHQEYSRSGWYDSETLHKYSKILTRGYTRYAVKNAPGLDGMAVKFLIAWVLLMLSLYARKSIRMGG
jgi:hypothetical protein